MILSLPSNPNHKILTTPKGIILTKLCASSGVPPVSDKQREGVAAHQSTKGEVVSGVGSVTSSIPGMGRITTAAVRDLDSAAVYPNDSANVEGAISFVCASASVCLPHFIQRGSGGLGDMSSALFM